MGDKPICIVQLGRFGDVFNILPLCRLMNERGRRVLLVVADRFFDLVRGIDYADAHEWQGDVNDPGAAAEYFSKQGYEVWATQVAGSRNFPDQFCDNFTCEQWERAGHLADFHASTEGLISCDDAQAQHWYQRLCGSSTKPVIAVNLSAKSAPLSNDEMAAYQNKILLLGNSFKMLDLSNVQLPTIRLIPGILKRCKMLMTVDTSTLHLAGSVMCPTIALVPERHWHTPEPRRHWIGRIGYSEALCPDGWKKVESLLYCQDPKALLGSLVREPSEMYARWIIHVASTYDSIGEDARRNSVAKDTWRPVKVGPDMKPVIHEKFARIDDGKGPAPVYTLEHRAGVNGAPSRTSEEMGDPRKVPFLKDAINYALTKMKTDRDIVMLTNADTVLVPETWDMVRRSLHKAEAICSARADFRRIDMPIPWVGVSMPEPYVGTDLFAFTVRWWLKIRDHVPDVLLACEGWDAMLRWLVLEENPLGNLRPVVCYHEAHPAFWARNRFNNAGQLYNRAELTKWCKATGREKHLSDTAEWLFKLDKDVK